MSAAGRTLFRISATRVDTPTIVTTLASSVPSEIYESIKNALDCEGLESYSYHFWCTNGLRHEFSVYCDEEGLHPKALEPNHRVNAIADAGRFITRDFNWTDDETSNQKHKEAQGPNYFFGDVIIVVNNGDPLPDMSIYGSNPLRFITTVKRPSDNMIATHNGEATALFKTHYALAHKLTDENISAIKRGIRGLSKEEVMATCVSMAYVSYHIAPQLEPGAVYNPEFINLMKQWGMFQGDLEDRFDPREIDITAIQRERCIFEQTGNIGDIHLSDNHITSL